MVPGIVNAEDVTAGRRGNGDLIAKYELRFLLSIEVYKNLPGLHIVERIARDRDPTDADNCFRRVFVCHKMLSGTFAGCAQLLAAVAGNYRIGNVGNIVARHVAP